MACDVAIYDIIEMLCRRKAPRIHNVKRSILELKKKDESEKNSNKRLSTIQQ